MWPLGKYLLYNLRHQVLFILAPMLLILAASDLIERFSKPIREATGIAFAPDLLIGVAAVFVALIAPEILRRGVGYAAAARWSAPRPSPAPLRAAAAPPFGTSWSGARAG